MTILLFVASCTELTYSSARFLIPPNHSEPEKRLWDAADDLRANSTLELSEYSVPVF